ncbi:hypothetical protein NP233_g7633 [Leucocoprinus birnbaumii]|uniref:NACHT domain-containing protein n=1 Tax=Leucocoprinus birnbaumii TaxID=56174 RepID=A0AAD5YUF3_9AGAR|nr:hypothetical protein NP233_g7633 [Leucocoprinus birnbaumii]
MDDRSILLGTMTPLENIEETVANRSSLGSPMQPLTGQTLQVIPPDLTAQGSSPASRSELFANAHGFTVGSLYVDNRRIETVAGTTNATSQRDIYRVHVEKRALEDDEEKNAVERKKWRKLEEREAEEYKKWRRLEMSEWEKKGQEVLQKLTERSKPDAMLDRVEPAGYVPRCKEDTRESLRGRLTEWATKIETVERPLLWLFGPAGVGKSAVAQSVAETLRAEESFGAGYFFSRLNNRSDPDDVVPTLVYQLALLLPPYRLILGQFQELITATFLPDLTCRPFTLFAYLYHQLLRFLSHRPLLIVIDGLDECSSLDAQREFVELIGGYAHLDYHRRLRWMICSRPDPQITAVFVALEHKTIYLQEEIDVDEPEAQKDASCILHKGFIAIRRRFPHQLDRTWPDQRHVRFIAERASGHLGFASFILRFIGDTRYSNPARQSGDRDPLHPLDLLYTRIPSDIPKDTLPDTLLVLGVLILHGNEQLTAHVLANFLGLDQAAFYSSLHYLHSVLLVPMPDKAHIACIRVYHASFSDFLRDKARSGQYCLDEEAVHLYVVTRGLQWLRYFSHYPHDQVSLPEPQWVLDSASRQLTIDNLSKYTFAATWRAFPRVSEKELATLKVEIENFDFSLVGREHLRWYSKDDMEALGYFIRWLLHSFPQDAGEYSENDIVIMLIGYKSAGKSDFISLLTENSSHNALGNFFLPSWYKLRQSEISKFQATRVLHHPKYGNRIVLVDTPELDVDIMDMGHGHMPEIIGGWFRKKTGQGVKFSAFIYLCSGIDDLEGPTAPLCIGKFTAMSFEHNGHPLLAVVWTEWNRAAWAEGEMQMADNCSCTLLGRRPNVVLLRGYSYEKAWRIFGDMIFDMPDATNTQSSQVIAWEIEQSSFEEETKIGDKRQRSRSTSPTSVPPEKKLKLASGIDATPFHAALQDEEHLSRSTPPESEIAVPTVPLEDNHSLSRSSSSSFDWPMFSKTEYTSSYMVSGLEQSSTESDWPMFPQPASNPQVNGLVLFDDDDHMNRIKRLAYWFCIYDWMFSEAGKLKNPDPNAAYCTPGTRTQIVVDVVSWIQNPMKIGNILEVFGDDCERVLASARQAVVDSHTISLPLLIPSGNMKLCTSGVIAFIAIAIATQEERFAAFIESWAGNLNSETLPSPQSLFNLLFAGLDTLSGVRRPYVIMLDGDLLDENPEVLPILFGAQADPPIPILWILFSQSSRWNRSDRFMSMSVPPLTEAEKEIILLEAQCPWLETIERWSGGEHLLLPVSVVYSFKMGGEVKDIESESQVDEFETDSSKADPSESGSSEAGDSVPSKNSEDHWKSHTSRVIHAATSYLECFRGLGLILNQDQERSIDDICVAEHPYHGQYLPSIELAHDCSLGIEQFVLLTVLATELMPPVQKQLWTQASSALLSDNSSNELKTEDGTLSIVEKQKDICPFFDKPVPLGNTKKAKCKLCNSYVIEVSILHWHMQSQHMLAATNQPVGAVDHPKFIEMTDIALHTEDSVRILSLKNIQKAIIHLFQTNMKKLKMCFASDKLSKISLTYNTWQASNTNAYFAMTGHWVEKMAPGVWELYSALVGRDQR